MSTIVLSDIHLGSPMCQAKKVVQFLHNLPANTERIIINGDLFDSIDFTRLCKAQWKVLSELRSMSDTLELVWIRGNHDIGAEMVAHLIGAKLVDEYVVGDILIIHGHVFDTFLTAHPWLTWWADLVYMSVQQVSMRFARFLKYQSKDFLRNAELVKARATVYAEPRRVICGHTHKAETSPRYHNTGCWTDDVCHFIVIEDLAVTLQEYV